MLEYLKVFLAFLALLVRAGKAVETEVKDQEVKGAQGEAEKTGDTTQLDERL